MKEKGRGKEMLPLPFVPNLHFRLENSMKEKNNEKKEVVL